MKKKIMRGFLALIMVCAVMFSVASFTTASAASDEKVPRNAWDVTDEEEEKPPVAKYTDWAFNDDYTKVTVEGKEYDNCVVLTRFGTELSVVNLWASYLTNPYRQLDMTPDEFAFESEVGTLQNELIGVMTGSESKYPNGFELIAINWEQWQDTKYKDLYLDMFKQYYDPYHKDIFKSENDMISYLEDKSNNGLALGILKEKMTKEQAAEKYDLSKMKVTMNENEFLKTSDEYLAVSGGKAYFGGVLSFDNISDIKSKMASSTISEISTKTTVVLHLNDQTMSVTKGSETKLITLEAAPVALNGTTLVPVRAITEALGSAVEWDGITKEVLITQDKTAIKLKIGSKTACVNGNAVEMLESAQIINGKTVIPLRFISENMEYKVEWDGATSKITISN